MAKLIFIFALIPCLLLAQSRSLPILIDTDAGSDDFMAIAFLLSQSDVHVEAITTANGLAHTDAGARNLVRLLALAGRTDIPVFAGRSAPLQGNAEFPAEWRRISDELPGVQLPEKTANHPDPRPAADYLTERLTGQRPKVRILALGPLTNLAEVLKRAPRAAAAIDEIVIMGGALHVPGNLGDGGFFKTDNKTAEWNIFVDPLAARIVFRSGIKILLIPLDATNTVPIDAKFLNDFQSHAKSPLARFVAQVLEADRAMVDQGIFYAWDPLAAVALLHPGSVQTVALHIDVRQDAPEQGRTIGAPGEPNARVAIQADAAAFRRFFLGAFGQ
jgi:pyrimidine-specific ribonucleoside hydrolase